MISNKIIQKIEELRHNTDSKLKKVQECKVPATYKMKSEIQQTYFIDGQEYVYNGGKLILLIKNLPIYYNLKRNIFTDSITNMVNNKELHPFMIFLNGKFVKWSDIKLVHDFKERYILIENFDLASCYTPMDRTTAMIDIYNKWYRFSHNTYGNFPANSAELNNWNYDIATESVVCTVNSNTYIGFISDEKYDNYIHQLTVASTNGDDDVIGTVIAFHKDELGKEHTLSAIRCPGTNNGGMNVDGKLAKWMIVYNFGQSNQKLIADGSSFISTPAGTGWAALTRGCTIKIERNETSVTAITSQFDSNILDQSTKLTVDFNSDPVLKLFIGPKQYGYSCYSQDKSTFRDISFIDLRDNIILPKAEMVTLPFNIKYNENQTVLSSKNIFAFDQSGFCVPTVSGPMTTIDLDDPYIYYEGKYLTPGKVQATSMNPKYKISKINPLLFKNGKLYTDAKVDFYGLNTFLVDNGGYYSNNIMYKLFYYIYGNESKDNILNVINKNNAISKITGSATIPTYIEQLAESFDFEFDSDKSYYQNIADSLDYIIKYNPGLLSDVYKDANKIETRQYTGSYILSLAGSIGYVSMPRNNKNMMLNYPMIFVNGELYKYYHHISYRGNNFVFPVKGITATDVVEIVMFKDIDNRILEKRLISDDHNYYNSNSNININNLRIFSRDCYNRTFDIPDTDYLRYPVDFYTEKINDSDIDIKLRDSYYYDRKLYFVSSRQFRYYYTILKNSVSNITLPVEFAYCKNKNNYMIFINGRKIDNADFQFTNVDRNAPFEDLSLYIAIPLKTSDKIDVFYVPDEMKEVITAPSIPTNGNIFVSKNKLPYAFDKDLYFVFINGKKVAKDSIMNINSSKAKVINTTPILNLSIIRHVEDDEVLNQLFSSTNNIYDTTINNMSSSDINLLYGATTLVNIETDIKLNKATNDEVTDRIIRDNWLKTVVTKINSDQLPDIISYEYQENIPYIEKDSSGNTLIK